MFNYKINEDGYLVAEIIGFPRSGYYNSETQLDAAAVYFDNGIKPKVWNYRVIESGDIIEEVFDKPREGYIISTDKINSMEMIYQNGNWVQRQV